MSKADEASPVRELVSMPDADGMITSVNGQKLTKPIPFKKGERFYYTTYCPLYQSRLCRETEDSEDGKANTENTTQEST